MNDMKTIFKTLALGLLLMAVVSCEKHDLFDENTFTGPLGPETYWEPDGTMVKAGDSLGFKAQYYSTVAKIDHSEVWYDLWEKKDKVVTASLIKAFTYSVTSSTAEQKRILQTIQSYKHSESFMVNKDTLGILDDTTANINAYVLVDKFPVSYTLAPVYWVQPAILTADPADTLEFTKNLHGFFSDTFAVEFKKNLTKKMHMHDANDCGDVIPGEDTLRHYNAYMQAFQGTNMLGDTLEVGGVKMTRLEWMTDSAFDVNTNTWNKFFKQIDTVWSKTNFDTLEMLVDSHEVRINLGGRPPKFDTIMVYDTTYITKPWAEGITYVYDEVLRAIDSVWENHITFYDLIQGADGYSIEYKRDYYINAELRVYDEHGNYSRTDSKEIMIN